MLLYFYIRDETLGPMVMRVASFLPFQTTYYLNGHSFIEQELNRAQIGFRKNFAGFQAQWLNVHVDFPLLQRIALPITIGAVRYRVIRLCEVLLHGGSDAAAQSSRSADYVGFLSHEGYVSRCATLRRSD